MEATCSDETYAEALSIFALEDGLCCYCSPLFVMCSSGSLVQYAVAGMFVCCRNGSCLSYFTGAGVQGRRWGLEDDRLSDKLVQLVNVAEGRALCTLRRGDKRAGLL